MIAQNRQVGVGCSAPAPVRRGGILYPKTKIETDRQSDLSLSECPVKGSPNSEGPPLRFVRPIKVEPFSTVYYMTDRGKSQR